jgi:hypothetical protein
LSSRRNKANHSRLDLQAFNPTKDMQLAVAKNHSNTAE